MQIIPVTNLIYDYIYLYVVATLLSYAVLQYWICTICQCNKTLTYYEGCSNMNASSFITFVTHMLRQNVIRFYKGLYVTFKLAPDLKQTTVYLSSCRPLNEGHFSILTNSMLRTYQ